MTKTRVKKTNTHQIDQSGKVEDTTKNTVIAFTNDQIGAISLSAKEKRKLQEMFREVVAVRLFVDYTFSALLILLLKPQKLSKIVIDREYPGHEKIIESLVHIEVTTEIEWKNIGKSSRAHDIAYKVFSKKLTIRHTASAEQIWKLAKKITGGYLKTGLSPANRYSAPVNNFIISRKSKKSR